jgi:hypothetical protein
MILRYLQEHPDAHDTLEGIAQWWVLHEWTQLRITEVERVVDRLVAENLLVETYRTGSPALYRLNERKAREITRMLEDE